MRRLSFAVLLLLVGCNSQTVTCVCDIGPGPYAIYEIDDCTTSADACATILNDFEASCKAANNGTGVVVSTACETKFNLACGSGAFVLTPVPDLTVPSK